MRRVLSLAPFLVLAGCTGPAPELATASSASDLLDGAPVVLRATCDVDGRTIAIPAVREGEDDLFGTTIAGAASAQGHPHGPLDAIWFGMQLVPTGDTYDAKLATMFDHPWALPAPLVAITKTGLHAGDEIAFRDDTSLPGRPIVCGAKLVPQAVSSLLADPSIDSDTITTPVASFDLPLPNRLTCGLALRFADPLRPGTVDSIGQVLRISAGELTVTPTLKDERTLVIPVDVHQHGWDAFLRIESVDIDDSIGRELRIRLGQKAIFENVPCASPGR